MCKWTCKIRWLNRIVSTINVNLALPIPLLCMQYQRSMLDYLSDGKDLANSGVRMAYQTATERRIFITNTRHYCSFWSKRGNTALMWACREGHTEIVQILLAHPGIDPNLADRVSLYFNCNIHNFCWNCTIQFLHIQSGNTALMDAALKGFADIVDLLLAFPSTNENQADDVSSYACLLLCKSSCDFIPKTLYTSHEYSMDIRP